MDTTTHPDTKLYERDLYAWCEQQAAMLRERARPGVNDGLDYENLAEEIESLGKSQRREIRSRLRVLLAHLLKWRYQPQGRSNSWRATINEQRHEIELLLEDSPSLVSFARVEVTAAYPRAVKDAMAETGLEQSAFPAVCPFSDEQVLDPDFIPLDQDGSTAA